MMTLTNNTLPLPISESPEVQLGDSDLAVKEHRLEVLNGSQEVADNSFATMGLPDSPERPAGKIMDLSTVEARLEAARQSVDNANPNLAGEYKIAA